MIKTLQLGLEFVLGALILIVAYTQLIRPLLKKTPTFPFFRRRPNVEAEMEKVNEGLDDVEQQKALARAKRKLEARAGAAPAVKKD